MYFSYKINYIFTFFINSNVYNFFCFTFTIYFPSTIICQTFSIKKDHISIFQSILLKPTSVLVNAHVQFNTLTMNMIH